MIFCTVAAYYGTPFYYPVMYLNPIAYAKHGYGSCTVQFKLYTSGIQLVDSVGLIEHPQGKGAH